MTRDLRATTLLVTSLVLSACAGSDGSQVPVTIDPATGPTTPSATERWQYVAMGDSTHRDVVPEYEAIIEEELGVEVDVSPWINPDLSSYDAGGERAADLVEHLRADEQLRSELREAEVITFVVPLGGLIDACPFDPVAYVPTGTRAELRACLPTFLAGFETDVGALFDELVAIRPPSEALIRVVDNYQYFWQHFHDLGVYDVTRRYWPKVNDAIHAAAAEHGIPVARAYEAMNGSHGRIDGVGAGWVSSDQLHLSLEGAERVAELIAELGFEPAPS